MWPLRSVFRFSCISREDSARGEAFRRFGNSLEGVRMAVSVPLWLLGIPCALGLLLLAMSVGTGGLWATATTTILLVVSGFVFLYCTRPGQRHR